MEIVITFLLQMKQAMPERHVCKQRYAFYLNSVPTMKMTLTTTHRSV